MNIWFYQTKWKNNFVNKIIFDHYNRRQSHASDYDPSERQQQLEKEDREKRRIAIDVAVNNAAAFSDSEDDAFSA